ncbi:MAG TPA: hypothetical protein VF234_10290 [Limnochordia bacterium]
MADTAIDALLKKAGGKKKKGKKGRKIGRSAKHPAFQRYKSERRWESNKVRWVMRHLRRFPADLQARGWLAALDTAEAQSFLAGLPVAQKAA